MGTPSRASDVPQRIVRWGVSQMKTFVEYGISIPSNAAGPEVQTSCAQCSCERRKKNARCLSVNIDKMVWICHHCGWSGSLQGGDHRPSEPQHWRKPKYRTLDPRPQLALPQNAIDWFRLRGITDAVLIRNRVGYDRVYFPQIEDHTEALIFPYFRNGTILNRKYEAFMINTSALKSAASLSSMELTT